ncbi:MAG: lipopolysaccharide biosynthesis protein [Candidatus Hodarchaeota archaeon]
MGLFKDSVNVFIGSTLRRIVSIALVIITARLLNPNEFGIFTISLSICLLLSSISSFSLEASIAVAPTEEQASQRVIGICFFGLIFGIISWSFIYLFKEFFSIHYSVNVINALLIMLPILIPLNVIDITLQNYIGYLDKFIFLSISDIISIFIKLFSFLMIYYLLWQDYRSLILGVIFEIFSKIIIFFYASKNSSLFSKDTWSLDIFKSLWEAKNFVKFNFPSQFLNRASFHLIPFLLSIPFTEKEVGLFCMARNIISIPTRLSSRAIGSVFYPKAATEFRLTGKIANITRQSFFYGCQFSIFPAIFIASISGFLLPQILGNNWLGITPFVLIYLPYVIINAVETQIGIGFIFSILNKHRNILIGGIMLFILHVFPVIINIALDSSIYLTLIFFSLFGSIAYFILLLWIFSTVSISAAKAFQTYLKFIIVSGICVFPIIFSYLNQNNYFSYISIFLTICLFGLSSWFFLLNTNQKQKISFYMKRFHKRAWESLNVN